MFVCKVIILTFFQIFDPIKEPITFFFADWKRDFCCLLMKDFIFVSINFK